MSRTAAAALLALLCAACSSSPASTSSGFAPGTARLQNTFPFLPTLSWASAAATRGTDGAFSIVVTNLAGGADACLAASVGTNTASVARLAISLESAPAPGKYSLGAVWQASYRLADAACTAEDEGTALEGTLEIDSVDSSVQGIADVTFAGGRMIATFNAPFCSAAPSGASSCIPYTSCPVAEDPGKPPAEACLAAP